MLAVTFLCRGKPRAPKTSPKPRTGAVDAAFIDAKPRASTVTGRGVSCLQKLPPAGEMG